MYTTQIHAFTYGRLFTFKIIFYFSLIFLSKKFHAFPAQFKPKIYTFTRLLEICFLLFKIYAFIAAAKIQNNVCRHGRKATRLSFTCRTYPTPSRSAVFSLSASVVESPANTITLSLFSIRLSSLYKNFCQLSYRASGSGRTTRSDQFPKGFSVLYRTPAG